MKKNDILLFEENCTGCGLHCTKCICIHPTNPPMECTECKTKIQKLKPKKPFTIDLVLFGILMFGVVFMLIFAFIVLGWYISTLI